MNKIWEIVMWESHSGKRPVEKWIKDLPHTHKRKIDKLFGLLEEFGPMLSLPHNKNLGGGLYELRDTSTGPGYRIYYGIHDTHLVILLTAGDKTSQERDIITARKRLEDEEE